VANLAVTAVCNLTCPYCFAADLAGAVPPHERFVSRAEFERMLDFLDRSGIDEARLLGGEPTLHPDFIALAEAARKRGKRLIVFSNGLMRHEVLDYLASLSAEDGCVMVNVGSPATVPDGVHRRQVEALRRLQERAVISFNLYRLDLEMAFLLDVVAETGCYPLIRLGLAQPCLSAGNIHIHPTQYRAAARKITAFAEQAAESGVRIDFDCGFVRCMFTNAELATLRRCGMEPVFRCSPILDLNTVGEVIHCYPLADLCTLTLDDQVTADVLRHAFEGEIAPLRLLGIYPECSACPLKAEGMCSGGCLAAAMGRLQEVPAGLLIQIQLPGEAL
jgi:MoaA/NifB/PqqE/SkfB family radical SAM enzyme